MNIKGKYLIPIISFLLGLCIGLIIFYNYWKIQDYKMYPEEIVATQDSTISISPSYPYFQSLKIQEALNNCFGDSAKDVVTDKVNKAILTLQGRKDYGKIYILELNENDFKILYQDEYLITRKKIEYLSIIKIISEKEFEDKYNRRYKHASY
jgi:hypothetical protein